MTTPFTGLRGAVAFALAEDLKNYFSKEVTGYIVTTTLLIVLFTIVILGGSTLPLLKVIRGVVRGVVYVLVVLEGG